MSEETPAPEKILQIFFALAKKVNVKNVHVKKLGYIVQQFAQDETG